MGHTHIHITDSHPVTNKMQVNLHMLRPLMLNRVGGEVHDADVVAVDERALGERVMKLSQELSETGRLNHAVSNSPVLRLNTRAGDNWLSLGRPGDQVAAEEDDITRGRAARVRAPHSVSVSVDDQLSRRRPVEDQAEVNRASDVAKKVLQRSKV
jgi:hypothetical protein